MTAKSEEWKELFSLTVSCKYKCQPNKMQDARISKIKNVTAFKFCNYYGFEAKRLKKILINIENMIAGKHSKTSQ